MDWRSRFNATFFSTLPEAGLPQSARYARSYDELRVSIDTPDDLLGSAPETSGPLGASMVRDVYTFGVFVGRMAGRLLAMADDEIDRSADWCGRFNLGISLFDYLSD